MAERKFKFEIQGMRCEACEKLIGEAVKEVAGVKGIVVSYQDGRAEVVADDDGGTGQRILKVIEKKGYQARRETEEAGRAAVPPVVVTKSPDEQVHLSFTARSVARGTVRNDANGQPVFDGRVVDKRVIELALPPEVKETDWE